MTARLVKLILTLLLTLTTTCMQAGKVTHVKMPASEELYCMHFDRNGLLWIGTTAGVRTYDGYSVREMFERLIPQYPQLGSDIRSITSDNDERLWVGTTNGLVSIDLKTEKVRTYHFPKKSQQIIYQIFIDRRGILYVATDDGFSIYNKVKDSFRHFNTDNSTAIFPDGHKDRYTGWGVKDFVETPDGNILIGTWGQGLWQYSPKTGLIHAFGRLNALNSCFSLLIDKANRLWIGTEISGIQRLDKLDDYRLKTLHDITGGPDIANPHGQVIISDLTMQADGRIYVSAGDTVAALTGMDGALWIATRNDGIERIDNKEPMFRRYASGTVRNIYTDNGRQFYLDYGYKGLGWTDIKTGELRSNKNILGFAQLPAEGFWSPVSPICRRHNGELWVGSGVYGILVRHVDGSVTTISQQDKKYGYIKDNVTAIYESRDHSMWLGQRMGVSVITPDGRGRHLDVKNDSLDMTGYFMVNDITEDHDGNIWISSSNGGIVRISHGHYKHYTSPAINVTACYEDSHHRLWAICSRGLLRYNRGKDCFESTASEIHLTGRQVQAINEDRFGCLWIATDKTLARLSPDGRIISFTTQDGLPERASFMPNSTFRFAGNLYFGTTDGFIAFTPKRDYGHTSSAYPKLIITDISIDGTSYYELDSAEAYRISHDMPVATREITIPAYVGKFGVEFALLSYANQDETLYEYRLEGLDDNWQYADGHSHKATFERVPSGTYNLLLRAADSRGQWHELPCSLKIKVLPPWYASWWAYLIYICVIIIITWFVRRYMQMQQQLKASRRFSTILQSSQITAGGASQTGHFTPSNKPSEAEKKPVSEPQQAETTTRESDLRFMAKATQLVKAHLDDADYNRDSMAADLNMSVSTLYKRLRGCTDMSIQTFIQTIRLNAACDILRAEPDIRISELAYRVGFNTPKYFSQCFKREFGMLPGDFMSKA